jgi:hypothetical protein
MQGGKEDKIYKMADLMILGRALAKKSRYEQDLRSLGRGDDAYVYKSVLDKRHFQEINVLDGVSLDRYQGTHLVAISNG